MALQKLRIAVIVLALSVLPACQMVQPPADLPPRPDTGPPAPEYTVLDDEYLVLIEVPEGHKTPRERLEAIVRDIGDDHQRHNRVTVLFMNSQNDEARRAVARRHVMPRSHLLMFAFAVGVPLPNGKVVLDVGVFN
jgi:hypothetical protein